MRLVRTFIRELTVARTLPREPEPDLVMDDPDQVAAYAEAGRIDGVMAASYLYESARISQVLQGCAKVLDLGCGPATQLAQIAQLNPGVQFTGLDMSPTMLDDGAAYLRRLGVTNVRLVQGDATRLEGLDDRSFDAVISTMALHHLPKLEDLDRCFAQVRRVLEPDGAIYFVDFGRLKSLKSVIFFAYMNAKYQPHLFSLDYERSLRAAFLFEDFSSLARKHFGDRIRSFSTYKVPMLVVIKTPDKPLLADTIEKIRELQSSLKPRYRKDLRDLRLFFRLGGMGGDPFR